MILLSEFARKRSLSAAWSCPGEHVAWQRARSLDHRAFRQCVSLTPTRYRQLSREPRHAVAWLLSSAQNFSAPRAISSVALITTFLVDGDKSGDDNKKQLTEAGVQNENVFQLPKHKAIEDLVDRAVYLLTVN